MFPFDLISFSNGSGIAYTFLAIMDFTDTRGRFFQLTEIHLVLFLYTVSVYNLHFNCKL